LGILIPVLGIFSPKTKTAPFCMKFGTHLY